MSCPTCDHTMQNLGVEKPAEHGATQVFWCPRCGTVKYRIPPEPDDAAHLICIPFWIKKQPNIEIVRCNDLLHEVGEKGGDHANWMQRYMQEQIEAEVKKRLAAALELRLRELRMA